MMQQYALSEHESQIQIRTHQNRQVGRQVTRAGSTNKGEKLTQTLITTIHISSFSLVKAPLSYSETIKENIAHLHSLSQVIHTIIFIIK
jgi:hypothetical protein